jgi:hypothetical protein
MKNHPRRRIARPLLSVAAGAAALVTITGCTMTSGNLRICRAPDGGLCFEPPVKVPDAGPVDGGAVDGGDGGANDGGLDGGDGG